MSTFDRARAERAVRELLAALDVPLDDPELAQTPERVADAWYGELLAGYRTNAAEILSEATDSSSTGLVVVASIRTTTMCPHHLLPAAGVAHVGYLPGPRVIGLGAIARLVDCFARRLILQEDLGERIADALMTHLQARGAAVMLDLAPSCVTARGENQHTARAITQTYRGEMEREQRRAEFLHSCSSASPGPRS